MLDQVKSKVGGVIESVQLMTSVPQSQTKAAAKAGPVVWCVDWLEIGRMRLHV